MKWTRMALGVSIALSVALSPNVGASGDDAPRHNVYAATARCFDVPVGFVPGVPVTSVMETDTDAIDGAVQRFNDLGMVCLDTIAVTVVYLP